MDKSFELNFVAQQHFPDAHYWSFEEGRNYGFLLMKVASSDGKVSDRELHWLTVNFAQKMGFPDAIVDEWKQFAYKKATIHDLIKNIPPIRNTRFIYDAIKMCSADGLYAFREKKAVEQVASIMQIPNQIILGLELLVESEIIHDKPLDVLLNAV